jgi:hypothetical protein
LNVLVIHVYKSLICINPGPEDPSSPGYAAAGPGFEFTLRGVAFTLDYEWHDGRMEWWNNGILGIESGSWSDLIL